MDKLLEIKGHPGFYITDTGSFYKIIGDSSQQKLHPRLSKRKSGYIIRLTDGQGVNVLHVILENFYPDWNGIDEVKFKIKNDTINPKSIYFVERQNTWNLSEIDLQDYADFKCKIKADSSNQRCIHKVTGFDVLQAILIHDKRCHYCKDLLVKTTWQLDHFYPLAHGGINVKTNIVPACRRCNIMKNDLDGYAFIQRCKYIYQNSEEYVVTPDVIKPAISNVKIPKIEATLIKQIRFFKEQEEIRKRKEVKTKEILSKIYKPEILELCQQTTTIEMSINPTTSE